MSKLSEYQIRAMIGALERTAANGKTSATRRSALEKLASYRLELAERTKTVQVERPDADNHHCLQQITSPKPFNLNGSKESGMEKKDALTVASEQIEVAQQSALDTAKWIGRQQAFAFMANRCSAAQAEILKRLKDTSAHKEFGLSREDFCTQQLGISRVTADRIIANYEEFGSTYFAVSNLMRISPVTYRLLAPAINDNNEIEYGEEKISIVKTNADRIIDVINAIRQEAAEAKRDRDNARGDLSKARKERDGAKKAAENARHELAEMKRRDEELFADADADHKLMLRIQSSLDMAFAQLRNVGKRDLSTENQGRLIGLTEYAFRHLTQISNDVRSEYGVGWNAPEPGADLMVDQMHSGTRNLVAEYVESNAKKN